MKKGDVIKISVSQELIDDDCIVREVECCRLVSEKSLCLMRDGAKIVMLDDMIDAVRSKLEGV